MICVNQTVYGWDLSANVTQPRLIAPYTDVFGADAKLESVAGNDKYIGFLIRVKEDNQEGRGIFCLVLLVEFEFRLVTLQAKFHK